MNDTIEITSEQSHRLTVLMDLPSSNPRTDTVGPRHNPTTRTRAQVVPNLTLHSYLKERGWLKNNQILVCHKTSYSDQFVVSKTSSGHWTIAHIPVG